MQTRSTKKQLQVYGKNNIKFKNARERIYKEPLPLFPYLQTKRFTLHKILPKKCREIKLGKMIWNLIIQLVSEAF